MKKKFITIAAALALVMGIQANAQSNDNNSTSCTKTEQCTKAAKARDGKSPRMNKQARAFFSEQAFDGIQLTDAQKAGLQTLNEQQAAKRSEMAAAAKAAKAEAKQQRQLNDSTKRVARAQARRDYLNGVKSVLTPDQYVVFLENIVVEQPVNGGRHHKMEARHDRKDAKGKKDGKDMRKDSRKDSKQIAGKAKSQKSAQQKQG